MKKHIYRLLSAFLVVFLSASTGFSQKINPTLSIVKFELSNMKINTVEGTIQGMKGEVSFDQDNLTACSFNTSVDLNTINTGNKKRDKHLKNEDFFEVDTYPVMSFKSEGVTKTETGFTTLGSLTIKDVTKEVDIPFTVVKEEDKTTLIGTLTIDRKEYHVGMNTGNTMVGLEVNITIRCVLDTW